MNLSDQMITLAWIFIKIMAIILPLIAMVAYLPYFERKVIAYMHDRIGPNRVGWFGLLQPIADAMKLLNKEIITPKASNHYLFTIAPILAIAPALAAWAVVPFMPNLMLANINAGLLYLFSMSSLGVYGILIAGWASNSKYALLSTMRAAAQTISYEIGMGFCFVGVLLASGSLHLQTIVLGQQGGIWHWYALPLFPLFIIYWISAVAETNRSPFDVAEAESELVAGFHVEYSGMAFAIFFLAEYANMILVSTIASLLFLGGWLSPFQGIPVLSEITQFIPGIVWLLLKVSMLLFVYLWMRATLPRFRYDQIMRLGWKIFIPLSLLWVSIVAVAVVLKITIWFH